MTHSSLALSPGGVPLGDFDKLQDLGGIVGDQGLDQAREYVDGDQRFKLLRFVHSSRPFLFVPGILPAAASINGLAFKALQGKARFPGADAYWPRCFARCDNS